MRACLILSCAGLVACTSTDPPSASSVLELATPPRNLLLVSVDTLRRDRVGRYAADTSERTPFVDQLLREGVAFEDHRSCSSWTYASMLCALTGAYNEDIGFVPARDTGLLTTMPPDIELLTSWLDMDSVLVSANPLVGSESAMEARYTQGCSGCEPSLPAANLVDRALQASAGLTEPWVLHVHFMDPHLPYKAAPASYLPDPSTWPDTGYNLTQGGGFEEAQQDWPDLDPDTQQAILDEAEARYAAEIRYFDDELSRLFGELGDQGALDDTLVMLWSDHGEQFFEHDGIKHGRTVYAEETLAMAGFWGPMLTPATVDEPTSHVDLVPTLLAALGHDVPDSVTGRTIGAGAAGPRFTTSLSHKSFDTRQSVQVGPDRLIYTWEGTLELYDVWTDPGETNDRFVPGHEVAATLWPLLAPRVGIAADVANGPAYYPPPLSQD